MKRIFNHELYTNDVSNLMLDSACSTASLPFSAVDLMGSKLMDVNTGEIIAERPNFFYAQDRVGTPFFKEEVGERMLKEVSRPSDLKARVFALTGMQPQEIFSGEGIEEISDEELYKDLLENEDDDEVQAFNDAMGSSPYSCDEQGISNLEKALASSAEERKQLQEFMGQMSHPFFQELAKMDPEQRDALMQEVKKTLDNQNTPPPPTNPEQE